MTKSAGFDMKKITTPLLLHLLGTELRFPKLFLLARKLTLSRFKKTIDPRFPRELVALAALPAWVYFQNFADMEIENNRSGLVQWNDMKVVERTDQRFEIKITRCMFHEFAVKIGAPEMTPIVCQIDNAMFNSYLPEEMTFDRGGVGRRISDGHPECNFIWTLHQGPARTDTPAQAAI
jgi:hypothetical protein